VAGSRRRSTPRRTRSAATGPRVVPCWEVQGAFYWFHYASAEAARAIALERFYVVSERGHQQHGPGLFVSTRNPFELTERELLTELFALQRMPEDVGGVVIFRRDERLLPTRKVGHTSYVHAAQPGDVLDLAALFLGFGIRDQAVDRGWLFSEGIWLAKP
jgi:hypothetical protein